MDIDKTLLFAGVGMPVLYFVALFAAGALYPDYSHIRQVASDLGAVGAPYVFAPVFNVALVGVALAGLAGALGLGLGLQKLGVNRLLCAVTGLAPAMPSISLGMSGLFPLPSPYHSSFMLLLGGMLTPVLGGLALRRLPETSAITLVLNLSFAAALIVVGILFGIGELVTDENLGLWLRIWAAVTLPAFGILCLAVKQRLP